MRRRSTKRARPRSKPALFGRNGCTYYEKLPAVDDLARQLAAAVHEPIRVDSPPGVLFHVATQSTGGKSRVLVHLLNYTPV